MHRPPLAPYLLYYQPMRKDVFKMLRQCQSWSFLVILVALFFTRANAAELCNGPLSQVQLSRAQAVRVIAKEKGYTEGLIFSNGFLIESLGIYGQSSLRQIDPNTGMAKTLRTLDGKFFGEGLAEVNQRLFQLTYKENVVFTYGQKAEGDETRPLKGEGWGLTQLQGQLVMSNGSNKLRFLDAKTLAVKREIEVHHGGRSYKMLNELESAHGMILANIYGADWVAIINPETGCLEGSIDLSGLRTASMQDAADAKCTDGKCTNWDFVANGIAFDEKRDELYFTGKNWPYIFVFKFPH